MVNPTETKKVGLFADKEPQLLLVWRPRHEEFLDNLSYARDTFLHPFIAPFKPGELPKNWRNVFVDRSIPRTSFRNSLFLHIAFVFLFFSTTHLWLKYERVSLGDPYKNTVRDYDISKYLPTYAKETPAIKPLKGQPEKSIQRIVSAPPRPDNTEQTIVNPAMPNKLLKTVPLPNFAVNVPVPLPPVPTMERSKPMIAPELVATVVAPVQKVTRMAMNKIPQMEIDPLRPIAKPERTEMAKANLPTVDPLRPVAEISRTDMGKTPLLEVDPLRPMPKIEREKLNAKQINMPTAAVSGPPAKKKPQAGSDADEEQFGSFADKKLYDDAMKNAAAQKAQQGSNGGNSSGRPQGQLLAIQLHPTLPNGPIAIPKGSRSGTFAATPEGKAGAPGTPDIPANKNTGSGNGSRGNPNDPLAGISISSPNEKPRGSAVVADPNAESTSHTNRDRVASKTPEQAEEMPNADRNDVKPLDDKIFGKRKYYSIAINLPNLNSAGGSWIVHFAEKQGPDANKDPNKPANNLANGSGSNTVPAGAITAPVAVLKSDPAYPQEFSEDRTEGTVTLYAIIRADGSVTDIAVMRGIQRILDENAKLALGRWRFRPAEKNGVPIDIEAVIQVPFKASRRKVF